MKMANCMSLAKIRRSSLLRLHTIYYKNIKKKSGLSKQKEGVEFGEIFGENCVHQLTPHCRKASWGEYLGSVRHTPEPKRSRARLART